MHGTMITLSVNLRIEPNNNNTRQEPIQYYTESEKDNRYIDFLCFSDIRHPMG